MPSLLPGLDVGIQDVHLNGKVVDVMRNSKSQVRGVPGQRHVGRAVAGRRTAGATDIRALADDLGAALLRAVRQGVADESPAGISRGLPQGRAAGISWYAFALEYMEMKWPLIAAKTRDETNDALCAITRAMLRDVRGRPSDELLRRAMRGSAFVVPRPEPRQMPADVRQALRWVAGGARPLADLMDPA
ncbi:hypothetical protein [Streptomyces caeruleatus]|uniref:hypothetical protein n=1 Tax=Streptomyces caeruleatus TaxID=661399 RepID=UPI000A6191A1|nr:hypothetical protein [Streptomyces caeruleatus]